MEQARAVAAHYGGPGLAERLLEALAATGKNLDALVPEDLAPVEEMHLRGRAATVEMAELAAIEGSMHVLDVGCGIGGPARYLAHHVGCRVTGIDLTTEFVRTAGVLSERVGLGSRVAFREADALDLPFADDAFDRVWTQHAAMNIADRAGLYAELHRVLRPGGRLAIYDIVAASGEPLHFPVPWASAPAISHLLDAAEMRRQLEAQGFVVRVWRDLSEAALAWARARRPTGDPGPLGPALIMGAAWRDKVANVHRNLEEGRIGVVQAILEPRP